MAKPATVYVCVNDRCPLGPHGQAGGRFTGGITKELASLLTGDPEPELYGDGVCPNCGQAGEERDPAAEQRAWLDDQIAALDAQRKALK